MQILKVLIDIQMRTLKTEVENGSLRTAFVIGYSILRHRRIHCNTFIVTNMSSKGNEVHILQDGRGNCGNTNKLGDIGMCN